MFGAQQRTFVVRLLERPAQFAGYLQGPAYSQWRRLPVNAADALLLCQLCKYKGRRAMGQYKLTGGTLTVKHNCTASCTKKIRLGSKKLRTSFH